MSPLSVRTPTDDQVDNLRHQLDDQVEKNSRLADRCIALNSDRRKVIAALQDAQLLLMKAGDEIRALHARVEAAEMGGGR